MSHDDRLDSPEPEVPEEAQDAEGTSGEGPDMTAFEESLGDESLLAQTITELEETKEALARSRAETYNVSQEFNNFVRRSKAENKVQLENGRVDVLEALLGVLDDIDAARQAGALDGGPFSAIAEKLEETLSTRFKLERYGAEGEPFDPQIHEALTAQTNPEVEVAVVSQVLQPGYQVSDRVIRATKVMVDNPE